MLIRNGSAWALGEVFGEHEAQWTSGNLPANESCGGYLSQTGLLEGFSQGPGLWFGDGVTNSLDDAEENLPA